MNTCQLAVLVKQMKSQSISYISLLFSKNRCTSRMLLARMSMRVWYNIFELRTMPLKRNTTSLVLRTRDCIPLRTVCDASFKVIATCISLMHARMSSSESARKEPEHIVVLSGGVHRFLFFCFSEGKRF